MRTNDQTAADAPTLKLAVVGAGPAGLTLALLAAEWLPGAQISLFDTRPLDRDISGDPRTIALSLGSVQLLQRLKAWNAVDAQAIQQVHVSQAPPTIDHPLFGGQPEVRITAAEQGVAQLGAVLGYGRLVAPLQARWVARAEREPGRLIHRFGQPVAAIKPLGAAEGGGVELDAGIAERFDIAVVAEGGVFAEQARKATSRSPGRSQERRGPLGGRSAYSLAGGAITHDYAQNAWVGTLTMSDDSPVGVAVERFTRQGPLALLPLPPVDGKKRAALVWCVPQADDEIVALTDAQRIVVIQSQLPEGVGRVEGIAPLKCFPLGLNAERTLVEGQVVRIGNAAQTLHPVAGQGLNLGLRDAYALVEALRRAPTGDIAGALRKVEWQRAPDRWTMIAATDFLARTFTWTWPGLPAARGLGLALLQALPPVKRAIARQMMYGRR